MTNFWPAGLNLGDTQSPREILVQAKDEWEAESGGLLSLILQDAETAKGDAMIVVHAQHVPSNRTANLFSVISRQEFPYPVTIKPKDQGLPDYLRKSYKTAGIGVTMFLDERTVTNKWVAETPQEFRARLEEAFNLGSVKSEVLSISSEHSSKDLRSDGAPMDDPEAS